MDHQKHNVKIFEHLKAALTKVDFLTHFIKTSFISLIVSISGVFNSKFFKAFDRQLSDLVEKGEYTEALNKVKNKYGVSSIEYATYLINLATIFMSHNEKTIVEHILSELMDVYSLIIQENYPAMNSDDRRTFSQKVFFVQPYIYSLLSESNPYSPEFITKCFEFRLMVKWTLIETSAQLKNHVQFDKLRDSLESEDMLVEIIRFREIISSKSGTFYYLFFVITRETLKAPLIIVLKNGNDLDGIFHKEYMDALMRQSIDFNSYDRYWGHIDTIAPNKNRVYVSTDGAYRYISLNSLYTNQNKYLLEDKRFIIYHDLRNLKDNEINKQDFPKTAMLVGNPCFYNKETTLRNERLEQFLPDISSSENEVKEIATLLERSGWSLRDYIGENVNKRIFSQTEDIGLLHLATHGYFRGIPRKECPVDELMYSSGLYLSYPYIFSEEKDGYVLSSEGYLYGKDIMQLNLRNVELVVLSACESGVAVQSNTGESFGFQRTFFHAGAKSIILSLWKVGDNITLELMTLFYSDWVITGDTISSFRKAQLKIKEKYRHPFYWASFILIHR